MLFSQYLRIEKLAGGSHCSRRNFVRATHKLLDRNGRSSNCRALRHAWIQRGLAHHTAAHKICRQYS